MRSTSERVHPRPSSTASRCLLSAWSAGRAGPCAPCRDPRRGRSSSCGRRLAPRRSDAHPDLDARSRHLRDRRADRLALARERLAGRDVRRPEIASHALACIDREPLHLDGDVVEPSSCSDEGSELAVRSRRRGVRELEWVDAPCELGTDERSRAVGRRRCRAAACQKSDRCAGEKACHPCCAFLQPRRLASTTSSKPNVIHGHFDEP